MTKQLLEQALDFCKALSFTEGYGSNGDRHSNLETHINALESTIAAWSDEPTAWLKYDRMRAMPNDEKLAWIETGNMKSMVEEYTIPLYIHPAPKQALMSDEELTTLKHRAALYEHIRKFNPNKFVEFYLRNIKGGGAFDDLVYQDLLKEQSL